MKQKPIVALVGRPNVGKSTLFNRLVGERMAVTDEIPGTTRDRLQSESHWNGIEFLIIDTGGIEVFQPKGTRNEAPLAEGSIEFVEQIKAQALLAVNEADLIIMVVDVMHGVTAADEEIAEILRRTNKPIVVAANKADDLRHQEAAYDFYSLGVGAVFPISAIHGLGVGDLLDGVVAEMDVSPEDFAEEEESDQLKIAVVGRPNAGKSTLVNLLLGEERNIVSPIAGTTRDAIDSEFIWNKMPVTLIDTAGIRRRGRIEPGVEKFSVLRAMRSIERCDVALLIVDSNEGITDQDEHIAGHVIDEYKSLIIIMNKWDAVDKSTYTMTEFLQNIRERLHFVDYAPVLFISALNGQRVHTVMETAHRMWETRFIRIPTSEVNRIVRNAVAHHAPPPKGTKRLKIYYGTQVRTAPPTFVLHVNDKKLMHFTYRRYLENQIRASYPFEGTPIRISLRDGELPS